MLIHQFRWHRLGGLLRRRRTDHGPAASAPSDRVLSIPSGVGVPLQSAVFTLHVLLVIAVIGLRCSAAEHKSTTWLTGDGLLAALAEPTSVTWEQVPFREYLQQLARAHRVCVFLDRRVDPSQEISFDAKDTALGTALQQLAQQVGARVTLLEAVVYMGPEPAVVKLAAQAAARQREVGRLPGSIRRRLAAQRAWHWDELSVPRQLLGQLAEQGGVTIEGLDQVTYDLWPSADLPKLSWINRLSIVLAGFDLSFAFVANGRDVRVVPYPKSAPDTSMVNIWPALPHAAGKPQPPMLERTRYTMTVAGHPIGAVLKTLEVRSGLTFEVDPAATQKLNEVAKFEVRDATVDQLLDALLGPAGLTFKRRDRQVLVTLRPGR